jgi:hypothetical protein
VSTQTWQSKTIEQRSRNDLAVKNLCRRQEDGTENAKGCPHPFEDLLQFGKAAPAYYLMRMSMAWLSKSN